MFVAFSDFVVFFYSEKEKNDFLDITQTNQIRGFAILLVVIGHFFVHVSSTPSFFVYGGAAVSIFLYLSGYGLTLSIVGVGDFKRSDFIKKRLFRVLIPYWIITFIFIILDRIILNNSLSFTDMLLTVCGINISPATRHIDYTRWFITLLFFWYVIFFITNKLLTKKSAVWLQMLIAICVSILSLVKMFPGSYYQIISFPLGCLTALHLGKIRSFWETRLASSPQNAGLLIFGCAVLFFILPLWSLFKGSVDRIVWVGIFLVTKGLVTVVLIIALALILDLWSKKKQYSAFLSFCGAISYEMYLIHGPLLIKYNPVMGHLPLNLAVLGFLILFILIILISLVFKYVIDFINSLIMKFFGGQIV